MAMLTVYFLLLLCSVSPFVHAGFIDGGCTHDSYCPAGRDCSKNSSLCVAGTCNFTAVPSCERDVSVAFSTNSRFVEEGIGQVELTLTLDGPIDCCSVSVAVKFEDGTAKGDEDYVTPKDSYVIVKFPAGRTQVSFFVTIIDDELMEGEESFTISIFDLSVPWGVALGGDASVEITITDDDSTTVSFRKSTFRVKENEGQVQVELILTVPALFNITVTVTTTNNNLSVSCVEFSAETYTVTFANGTTSEILPINITDDGIYEGDESFTLEIQDGLQDLVSLGTTRTATVVIEEDEEKTIANFEKKMYTVQEHAGSVAPKIILSKPSPCCFILHAQLMNMTAEGRTVDFGHIPSKIYNYTFNVGSICASPDANITINDDMIKEDEETFKISIIDYSLPFGVMSGGPAIITINDNDNCISLQYSEQTVSEDEGQIFLRACFEKPPTNDLIILFNSRNGTAFEGNDYATGPYEVTFKKEQRCRYFTISIFNNMVYEDRKNFQISIDAANLPNGVVPCDPSTVTITILDDEFECCFEELSYEVVEGERQDFTITCSRQLPYLITLTMRYQDDTATLNSDYSIQQRSLRLNTGSNETSFYVRTREDTVQEDIKEYFKIELDYNGKPNNTECSIATVCILDDDDLVIKFEYIQYRRSESSSFTIRLVVNKVPASTFSVILYEEDDSAEGGYDYKLQLYRNIRFIKGGSRYYELKIEPIDDDKVECLEQYNIRIETSALPPRIISLEPTTRIYLQDNDKSTITRDDDKLKFSKEVVCDLEIRVDYYTGSPRSVTVTLPAGETEVTLDVSRRIQRITIFICDCLSTSQFIVRASSVYLRS